MPDPARASDSFDMQRKCARCKHPCSLSAVICECRPRAAACLRHFQGAQAVCRCPAEEKVLLYWYSYFHPAFP